MERYGHDVRIYASVSHRSITQGDAMSTSETVRMAAIEIFREVPAVPHGRPEIDELFVDACRWAVREVQMRIGGNFLDSLYGPAKRWIRAGIVAIATEKKVPTSAGIAGWNEFRAWCHSHVKPAGMSNGGRDMDFNERIWEAMNR